MLSRQSFQICYQLALQLYVACLFLPYSKERATLAMLSEPSFQISCLELLVDYDGDKESGAEAAAQVKDRQDDFKLGFKNCKCFF